MLRKMVRRGTLNVIDPLGTARSYGDGSGTPVTVRLNDPAIVRRLVLRPEMAMGEGYMDGAIDVEGDALTDLIELLLRNHADDLPVWWQAPRMALRQMRRRLDQFNPASRARRNVAHHYDLSQALYDTFLDADRQYSCAYFRDPSCTLEQAQAAKKHHIAAKLCIEPGMRVLDIGCGWGGMALTLARDYGAQVTGVTLSRDQHALAQRRAEAEGLADRVTFRLQDYREVTERFDRIVSVGMFEHVGVPHYRSFFDTVRDRLPGRGVALIHTIGRMKPPGSTSPWLAKYIFPGGYSPALSEVASAVEHAGLWITDLEVWRLHYARTLQHWSERFEAALTDPGQRRLVPVLADPRFVRMWRFYLAASEMSFRAGGCNVFQIQLARAQDAVPLTRDYIHTGARSGHLSAAE
ncbi:class I SAM-dependent methyltransferase [Meridianimarinicoccus sp. RP-17]